MSNGSSEDENLMLDQDSPKGVRHPINVDKIQLKTLQADCLDSIDIAQIS
jgi:hypothetical protein